MLKILKVLVGFVLAMCLMNVSALAQSANDIKAQGLFFEAESALSDGQFDRALELSSQARQALGVNNALLQSVDVRAYYGAQQYQKAQDALATFYTLNPSDGIIRKVSPILANIDRKIAEEKAIIAQRKALIAQREAAERKAKMEKARQEELERAEIERKQSEKKRDLNAMIQNIQRSCDTIEQCNKTMRQFIKVRDDFIGSVDSYDKKMHGFIDELARLRIEFDERRFLGIAKKNGERRPWPSDVPGLIENRIERHYIQRSAAITNQEVMISSYFLCELGHDEGCVEYPKSLYHNYGVDPTELSFETGNRSFTRTRPEPKGRLRFSQIDIHVALTGDSCPTWTCLQEYLEKQTLSP